MVARLARRQRRESYPRFGGCGARCQPWLAQRTPVAGCPQSRHGRRANSSRRGRSRGGGRSRVRIAVWAPTNPEVDMEPTLHADQFRPAGIGSPARMNVTTRAPSDGRAISRFVGAIGKITVGVVGPPTVIRDMSSSRPSGSSKYCPESCHRPAHAAPKAPRPYPSTFRAESRVQR